MRAWSAGRYSALGLAVAGAVLLGLSALPDNAVGQSNFVQDGEAGFVATYFEHALPIQDASENGACPNGAPKSYREIFSATSEGQQREGESDLDHARRVLQGGRQLALLPDGEMICMNPLAGAPDPHHRNIVGRNIQLSGIDLDGVDSRAGGAAPPGGCAHDDFRGVNGVRNVDNQLIRVAGCMRQYQPSSRQIGVTLEMLQGSWGLLFTLSGVDDLRNDNEVELGIYSNADPIQIGAGNTPLPNATYASVQDPRYRATARGRIVDGVLTTEPVDIRFRYVLVNLRMERVLRHARVRFTIGADGALDGILAGYAPIDNVFDAHFAFRNAVDVNGEPTPFRFQVARGTPDTIGFTCQGVYRALQDAADGDRDPDTGRCTSVSTQYEVRAIPAFVVDAETRGANAELEETSTLQQATGENSGAPVTRDRSE